MDQKEVVPAQIIFLINKVKRLQKDYTDESLQTALENALPYSVCLAANPLGTNRLSEVLLNLTEKYNSPLLLEQEERELETFKGEE